MLVVLEGCDGGGKSTLARRLMNEGHRRGLQSITTIHRGQPPAGLDPFEEYEHSLDGNDPDGDDIFNEITSPYRLVVMDRWALGEVIYGPLYRDHSRLTPGGLLHVEMSLAALGAVKLLVQPADVDVIVQRLNARGEDFLLPAHVHDVHRQYEDLAHQHLYARVNPDPSAIIDLAGMLALDNHPRSPAFMWPWYLGAYYPSVLLVGDRRSDHKSDKVLGKPARPFTPHVKGSSSSYLMAALDLAGMRTDVGIVNAHEPGTYLDLYHGMEEKPGVIALGVNASKALTAAKIDHQRVPHPQWWSRFKHSDLEGYATTIKEAADGVLG